MHWNVWEITNNRHKSSKLCPEAAVNIIILIICNWRNFYRKRLGGREVLRWRRRVGLVGMGQGWQWRPVSAFPLGLSAAASPTPPTRVQ